jgi:hypothetical protein
MRRYWTRTEGRNDEVCWANSFSGRVRTDSKDPRSGLRIDADLVPSITAIVGDLEFSQGGVERAVRPTGGSLLVQEPYAIAPQEVASEVGLRLVIGVMVDDDGIMLDARLETIASLDRVSLSMSVHVTGNGTGMIEPASSRWPGKSLVIDRTEARWMKIGSEGNLSAAMISDLGEGGFGVGQRDGSRWELTFFEQPLEKGVILVGRWGLVPRLGDRTEEELREVSARWLARPTFL